MTEIEPEVELAIGGTYTDITPDAYFADGVTRSAGASAEGSETETSRIEMRLKSPDGKYANRNPLSPYFGLIGRNTPVRASVGNGTATMLLPLDEGAAKASTPDAASLDITGDIDVRIDLTPDGWSGNFENEYQELCAKDDFPGQKSWALFVDRSGYPYFQWSANGSTGISRRALRRVPFGPRHRGAVRVTLDVNNGSGGHTVTFYTAPTISGSWTQLGDAITESGTTSIFSSTASVDVGDIDFNTGTGARRQIHAFQLRSSIGGTIVANPVFLGQPVGTTSFADSTGKTWTLSGGAVITDRRNRFTAEVSEWEPRWAVGADDVNTPVVANGIMRRLQMGESPLQSTLRRRIPAFNPVAYWPMEDGENALEAASALPDVRPLLISNFTFQSDGTLGGSRALPEVSPGSIMRANIPKPPLGSPTEWTVQMVYRYTGTRPASNAEFLAWRAGGTVARWRILMRDGVATVEGYDNNLDLLFTQSAAVGDDVWDEWVRFRFTVEEVSGTVTWRLQFINIGQGGGSITNSYSGTAGHVSEIRTAFGASISAGRLIVGHLSATQETSSALDGYNFADHGFDGDRAGVRMARLAEEEGVPFRLVGDAFSTHRMGPQGTATFTELMRECEAVDGGVLYEDPDRLGLLYRTRETKQRQEPILTIPYSSLVQPLEPTDDDQLTRNDVTRSRTEGSSYRAVQEDGPMSIQLPPNGVGRYTDSQDLNVQLDADLEQQAGWGLHKGTWDEARYKKITILLHKHPELIKQVLEMQVGDLIRITDLPPFLPPGPVDLIVEGFSEDFTGMTWELTLNCSPGGIWAIGVSDGDTDTEGNRADTSGSEVLVGINSSATLMYVQTTSGPQWITTADFGSQFPFSVTVGGEEVEVTAATGAVEDTFTRTVASGWGTADTGQAWTDEGGASADYSVASGRGQHTLTSVNVSRRTHANINLIQVDVQADIQTSALATGAAITGSVVTRYTDGNNLYMARLTFNTDQTIDLQLRKRVASSESDLGTFRIPVTHVANTDVRVRLQVSGDQLRARAWNPLLPEPWSWQVRATDTDLSGAASVGTRSILITGNSNASPVVRYDNFKILNPQAFTITRSENGIVKSHSAGTALSLTNPARAAL